MTYEEAAALILDPTFRGRVKVGCLTYASKILKGGESGVSGSQAARRWATDTFQQPEQAAITVAGPTVMEPGVQSQGAQIDDGGLQFAVENAVNKTL